MNEVRIQVWFVADWHQFEGLLTRVVYFSAYILLHCVSRVAKEAWGNGMAKSKGQLLKNRISH